MVINNLKINTDVANKIVYETAKIICNEKPESTSHKSLSNGLITSKYNVSKETGSKVKIFTDNYWL